MLRPGLLSPRCSSLPPRRRSRLKTATAPLNAANRPAVTFDPAAPDAGLLAPADEILFASSNAVWNFFFPDGAFTTVGEYDNLDPSGNVGHLSVQVTAVPEPTTVSLFALGAAVAAVRVRRWQKYVPKSRKQSDMPRRKRTTTAETLLRGGHDCRLSCSP